MGKEVYLKGGQKEARDLLKAGKIKRYFERDDKYFAVYEKPAKKAVIAAPKPKPKKEKKVKEADNGQS